VNNRISIDPKVLCGKPVIKGTRISVSLILELLGSGYTVEKILAEYPSLTKKDVLAAAKFASQLTNFEFHEHVKTTGRRKHTAKHR